MGFAGDNNRNRFLFAFRTVDTLNNLDNGDFTFSEGSYAGNNVNQAGILTTAGVITKLSFRLQSNGLDALSTNSFTVFLSLLATALTLAVDDTTGNGLFTIEGEVSYIDGASIAMRWLSDSTGTVQQRQVGWEGFLG